MGRSNIYGLRGLSAKDRESWEKSNLSLIASMTDPDRDRLYRNQMFVKRFYPELSGYTSLLTDSIKKNLGVDIDLVLAKKGLYQLKLISTPYKKNTSIWHSLFNVGDDMVRDTDKENLIAANNVRYMEAKEKLIEEYSKLLTDDLMPKEYMEKLNTYDKLSQFSPEERDRIYADDAFTNMFKEDPRWETLSKLHPDVRDELYSNPEFKTLAKYTLPGDNPDTRSTFRKAYEGSLRWLQDASRVFSGDQVIGMNPIDALILGGPTGGIVGTIAGMALTRNIYGAVVGGNIGSYGIVNAGYDYDKSRLGDLLDDAKTKSNDIIKTEVQGLTSQYNAKAEAAREMDPDYAATLQESWDKLTKDNPVWETFKDKSFALLTDGLKINLISTAQAISDTYGADVALLVFNDSLNDLISDNQKEDESSSLRATHGAIAKFSAGFGEALSSGYRNLCEGMADAMPFLSDETRASWKQKSINALKGLDADGNPLPFYLTNNYWDGVDKFATWNPDEIDNIRYDTSSDEYKNYIANGGTREDWIREQETYGEFKGTGISTYKRLRKTDDQHDWFSEDGLWDATEMSGYIANQLVTSWALKKTLGAADRTLGHATRGMLSAVVKEAGASPQTLMSFLRGMISISQKALGLGIMAGSSVPISVGYAMQTFDDVRRNGAETIGKQIDEEIKGSEEFTNATNLILKLYTLAVLANQMTEQEAQDAMEADINKVYQGMRAQKQKEHIEDYKKLDDAANDAYNTDFAIEMIRNVGVDMAFKGWMYKDATKMVKGARPSVLMAGKEWGYGLKLLNSSSTFTQATASKLSKLGNWAAEKTKVFNKYVENADGTISRNTSWLRNGMDYSKEAFKNVWGGYYSNHMDDVTVGFAEGYGLNEFNNYIAQKYRPETYDAMSDGIIGNYLAGIHGAGEKFFDKQTIKDGIVGALGSFVSVNPMGAFKYMSRLGGKEAYKLNVVNDASGQRRSRIERLNDFFGNPILGTLGMVKEQNRALDQQVNAANQLYKKHADKLASTATLINWMQARQENQDWGGILNLKDGNEGLGFALLNTLDLLNQTSEGHSTVYANYMLKLQDLADGNISAEEIQNFINAPENKQTFEKARVGTLVGEQGVKVTGTDGQTISGNKGTRVLLNTENGKRQYAADRIQYNAKKLLELNESYRKNRELVEGVFGEFNGSDDAATQLTYSLTMQDAWKDRLKSLNKKLTGTEQYSTEVNDKVAYRSFNWASKTVAQLDSQIANYQTQLEEAQKEVERIKKAKKDTRYRTASEVASETLDYEQQLKRQETVVKAKKNRIKKLTQQRDLYNRLIKEYGEKFDAVMDKIPEGTSKVYSKAARLKEVADAIEKDSSLQDKIGAVSEEEIMRLNPKQRANMILHPENYNTALLKVINSLVELKQVESPSFKEDVRDAAILYDRLDTNLELINNIINDKEAFSRYASNVAARTIMMEVAAYYNSDEFKASEKRASDRKDLLSHYTEEDENKKNIINATLDYLQTKNPNLDLNSTSAILEEFDKAVNDKGLEQALNKDDNVTLSTPDEEITMQSIRDILQDTSEKYVAHKATVAKRETDTVMPSTESSSSSTTSTTSETDTTTSNTETADAESREQTKPSAFREAVTSMQDTAEQFFKEGTVGTKLEGATVELWSSAIDSIELDINSMLKEGKTALEIEDTLLERDDFEMASLGLNNRLLGIMENYIENAAKARDEGTSGESASAPVLAEIAANPEVTLAYQKAIAKADANDVADFQAALEANTSEAYHQYLNNHQEGAFRDLARDGLNQLGEFGKEASMQSAVNLASAREAFKLNKSQDRYTVPTDVTFDMNSANLAFGSTWTEHADPKEIDTREKATLLHVADYLNGKISEDELKKQLIEDEDNYYYGSNDYVNESVLEIVDTYKKALVEHNEQHLETHAEAASRIAEALANEINDIFGGDKESASTIEFYNPLLWESTSPTVTEIKEMFRALFNDNINRIDELLAKFLKAKATERPKVYYYVPSGWHNALVSKLGSTYNMAKDLPIVAVVEDEQGSITFEGSDKKYTPIGLAPTSSYDNEWQNENHSVNGQFRTEAIRAAAIKEGIVTTDKLLTTEKDGKEVLVESSILKVKKHFPSSMGKNNFKSIADIILNKLGFSTPNTDNIFSGVEAVKNSSMYDSFRKYFLSKITKDKDKKSGKPIINYNYLYEGTNHTMLVMTMPINKTLVTVPAGLMGSTETVTSLLSVLQQSNAADILLTDGSGRSSILNYLKDRINYAIKNNLNTEKIGIDNNEYTGIEELEKALNSAFKSVFNDSVDSVTSWKLEVSKTPTQVDKMGQQIYQVEVNLRNIDTDSVDHIISLDLDENNSEGEELDNYAIMDFIKNFLFEENGMGVFRGDSTTNRIKGLGWNVDYSDLADYADASEHMDDSINRMKVNKANAFFDDGILSLTQDSMAGFNALISAPFNNEGKVLSSREVANKDNAADLPASDGKMPKASAKGAGSMIADAVNTAESIIKNILEYSRKRVAEITKQREASKDSTSTKNHLSATTIAGIMYDSLFSEDNPYHIPSTTLGTEIDNFVRDFFLRDANELSLFDINNIDYSKYPSFTKEAIDEMCRGLQAFLVALTARGEKIYTEEIVTDGTIKVKLADGRTIDVPNTGHLDMLTVDNLGKFHIYDMKTFLSEDNFISKAFENYATQLNVYKNLLENQWGIKVDSIHLIPITLNYPKPSSENTYTKEDNKLMLNGEQLQLIENESRFGIELNVKLLIADATSRKQDSNSILATKALKAIGFTQQDIENIKANKIDKPLSNKIRFSNNNIELNLTNEMIDEVKLDLSLLSEALKQKVNAIVEQLQRENGEAPSVMTSAIVEAPDTPGIVIKSELDNVSDTSTANTAEPGSNIITDEEHAGDKELQELIDETKTCYGGKGMKIDSEIFLDD